jgi:undecaprenyl diphosphate synthase
MSLKENINPERVPQHIAIIMDGNGRWAKQKGKMRLSGHNEGAKALKNIIETAANTGVKFLTVYAFSTENWNRPKDEVSGLMNLLMSSMEKEIKNVQKNGIKISVIGDKSKLPDKVRKKVEKAIEATKSNKKFNVIIALSYSGRWELVNAIKNITEDIMSNKISLDNITEDSVSQYLTTVGIPDPELLIRTSGEYRISNFLLYQLAYSELYFTDVLWPDFSSEEFYKAIIDYQSRERRFGKTSEQIKTKKN